MRVIQELQAMPDLDFQKAEDLYDKVLSWRRADNLQELYERVLKDGGPSMAAAVRRAVDSVLAESATQKPVTEECERDLQACLTAGAVKGAELALGQRSFLVRGTQPKSDAIPAGASPGSIDIEDMTD